ncbi:MAG: beta strand repeat-containing protein, partial [Bacteroidota bacterium]
ELGSGGYTLTIRPQTSAPIILSGTVVNTNGLVRFNGVSRLNFLGFSAAGTVNDTSLVVRSSSVSTPAIGFINGGSADTIRGVIFEGRTTSNAVVFFSGSTVLGGLPLSNITFRDNLVRQDMTSPTTSLPTTAILIAGAVPNFNNNIRIVNNAIYNFTSTGVNASSANGGNYNISNNHFYYDATVSATSHTYILMVPGNTSNGNIVNNNWMGGRARFAGGPRLVYTTGTVTGISLSTGLTTGTQVNNNVIANLTAGTGFTGITVTGTSARYEINNNRVGSVDSFTTIIANGPFRATGINSTASGDVTIQNDSILNIYQLNTTSSAAITGINVGSGFSNVTNINNNLVRGLFCNSANTSTTTASAIMGICVTSGSLNQSITNNRVQTLINTNNAASHSMFGIIVSNGANNINDNVVFGLWSRTTNINTSSTASGLTGIALQSSTNGTQNIIGNTVDSIYYTGTSGTQTIGIMATPPGFFITHNITVSNNIVRNMNTSSSAVGALSASSLVGIHYNNANTTGNYNVNVLGNRISVLNHLSATSSSSIIGLLFANSTALVGNNSNVNGNFVHSLRSDATAGIPVMIGIANINGFATYTNNMIRLGIDSGANLYSNPRTITGILQTTGTQCRYYHNTIYIAGAPSIGSANTQGYWAQSAITNGHQNDFRNNIVANTVANTGTATGINYAIILQDSLRHTVNYNLYHTPNNFTGRINSTNTIYRLLEDSIWSWKAVTGFDMTSASGDPLFIADANGVADVATLAVASSNNIERSGDPSLTSVANDFFGNSRSANSPSDIGAHAGNFTLANDLFPPAVSYAVLNNTGNTTANRILANVTITDNSGVPTTGATRPQLLYSKNGTTWFTAPAVNISGTPNNFTASFNLDQLQLAPLTIADSVFYYVIAQDNASNTISNAPFAVAGSVNLIDIYNHPARPNYYKFLPVIPANTVFQVGNGQPYPTLTGVGGFFEFINSRTLGGNVTAEITSNINEPGTVALNAFAEDGAGGYELTIRPAASTTTAHTLEGTSFGTDPLVVLNGTARVKITGIPTGGNPTQKLLRFRNNNNGAPTIQMQNGAIANRLNNLLVEGGNTNATSGVVTIMVTSGNTVPCSFDTISNCVIGNNTTAIFPAGIPNACIYADGQPNVFNNNCVILGNELYNFLNTGFRCNTNTGDAWQVLNNSVYNNLPISVTTAAFQPIDVFSGINGSGHTVQGNFVGGSGPLCSGVWNHTGNTGLNGIRLNSGNGATSVIRNNVIQNLNFNVPVFNSFIGIVSTNGNVTIGGTPAQGNLVGSTTNPNSFIHNGFSGGTGINYQGTGNINISGNTICGMVVGAATQTGAFTGISITNGNLTGFTDNVVGSTTMANAITYIGSGTLTGITLSVPSTYAATYTATNNTVSNLTATGTQTGVTVRGYTLQNSGIPIFTNNTVTNLTSASSNVSTTFGAVAGIAISFNSQGTIANNTVSAIRAINTSAATNAT